MTLKSTLLAGAAAALLAPAALAQEGPYLAIGAGLNYMQADRDFESDTSNFDGAVDYDNGIGVYTALGYDYGNSWRGELEFSYRNNDVRHIEGESPGFAGFANESNVNGDLRSHSILVNVLRDIEGFGSVKPYIGGGVGLAFVDLDVTGTNPGGVNSLSNTGSSERFAYQAIAGFGVDLAENLKMDLSYRYFNALKGDYDATYNGAASTVRTGVSSHSAFLGLRWSLGSPAAPAVEYKDCWDGSSVPLSAECPPQLVEKQAAVADPLNFIVYFDYDKSNISPEAADVIAKATASALQNDISTVVVSGNTDTSGSSAYNQALSERRARAVRQALIANGIPAEAIDTRAEGESNLAKATPDGTREPLNRRSEVVITFE